MQSARHHSADRRLHPRPAGGRAGRELCRATRTRRGCVCWGRDRECRPAAQPESSERWGERARCLDREYWQRAGVEFPRDDVQLPKGDLFAFSATCPRFSVRLSPPIVQSQAHAAALSLYGAPQLPPPIQRRTRHRLSSSVECRPSPPNKPPSPGPEAAHACMWSA